MRPQRDPGAATRRKFILAGLVGAGGLGLLGSYGIRRVVSRAAYADENPFAYEVDAYQTPELIQYQETTRWPVPREDPRKLAVGPDDHLFLAAGNYVSGLSGAGKVRMEVALTEPARCLAVASDGRLYVGLRSHLEVFDPTGKRLAKWEPPGGRPWFTGLSWGEDSVFAADAGNRVVLRYDLSGRLLGKIGQRDPARDIPGFTIPSPFFDLEWHQDGLLRVTNPGRHRVETYTAEGELVLSWGAPSVRIDGFCGCCNPINLALLSDGRCVTCEKGLPRVKVYTAQGELDSVVAGPESFPENAQVGATETLDAQVGGLDAAVDSQDRIHILDLVAGNIRTMTRKPEGADPTGLASAKKASCAG